MVVVTGQKYSAWRSQTRPPVCGQKSRVDIVALASIAFFLLHVSYMLEQMTCIYASCSQKKLWSCFLSSRFYLFNQVVEVKSVVGIAFWLDDLRHAEKALIICSSKGFIDRHNISSTCHLLKTYSRHHVLTGECTHQARPMIIWTASSCSLMDVLLGKRHTQVLGILATVCGLSSDSMALICYNRIGAR
jgi:hypothetical protein